MKTIYCISGLGADGRAFSKLAINNAELIVLPWLLPEKNETIEAYALRMSQGIKHANPILLGLSFGGMMAIEISKQLPVSMVILVSSIKSKDELPGWMKMVGKLGLHKLVPLKSTWITEPITNRTIGVTNEAEKLMVREYRKNAPLAYTNWAVDQVLRWKNIDTPRKVFHIHGDNDKIFSIKNINPTYIVSGAGHLMIMNRSEEISDLINQILDHNS